VTLVELVLALAIFASVMSIGIQAFRLYHGRSGDTLSKRLVLQMEARRALLNLYRELQEGIQVVSPPPGTTLPYLVYKDNLNNLRMVYLVEDPVKTKEEGRTIYRALSQVRDPSKATVDEPRTLMEHVVKLNFTTWHHGAVFISTQLRGGKGDFSLVNFVRLQNVGAEEG
jgi:hypothetical protein